AVVRRWPVQLRQKRRRARGVALEKKGRYVREREVTLGDPNFFRAHDRVFERHVRAAFHETDERTLAQPIERRSRRTRLELERGPDFFLDRLKRSRIGDMQFALHFRELRFGENVLLFSLILHVPKKSEPRSKKRDRHRTEKGRALFSRHLFRRP